MRRLHIIVLGAVLSLANGCDTGEKIANLEKQNQELKAAVEKSQAVEDYDFQAKCSKDAKTWFNENWSRDKDTVLLDFTNHYNRSLNKCFIEVEYHYTFGEAPSWVNDLTIYDVYENVKYGEFDERHTIYFKPMVKNEDSVDTCEVYGAKCKTLAEFNNLAQTYMNK